MWPLASGSSLSALCPKTNGVVSPNPEFRLVMLVGFGGFGPPSASDSARSRQSSGSAWAVPLHLEFQMQVCFWGCQMWPFASGSSLSALCPKANGAVSPNPEFRQFMLVGFGGFRGVPCVWNFSLLCQCVLAPQWGRPCTGILPGVVWVGSMMYCCWPCIGHFAALSGIARCATVIGLPYFWGMCCFFRLLWSIEL